MPRLVIVGNGIVQKNRFFRKFGVPTKLSRWIDRSNRVIRFNEVKNLGHGTGSKIDIHVLINRGKPAAKFCERLKLPQEISSSIREVWFSRPSAGHSDKFPDRSVEILRYQNIDESVQKRFPESVDYIALEKQIGAEPSSGLVTISMALRSEKFNNWDIHVVGFSWEGWHGHAWQKEKAYCLQLEKQGKIKLHRS